MHSPRKIVRKPRRRVSKHVDRGIGTGMLSIPALALGTGVGIVGVIVIVVIVLLVLKIL
jgi:hypothetical protein